MGRVPPMFVPAILPLLACAGDPTRDTAATVRDSAGVVIVENEGPAWSPEEAWRVTEPAMLDIGVVEGAPEYQLYRAASAVRLSDGRIVVANGGTNELRFYDATGRHLRSVGREGEGPGEFRDLQRVWQLRGDSLLAYDFFPARLSVFSPTGEFARSLRVIAPDGRQVVVLGPLEDGSLLAWGAPIWAAAGSTTGIVRDSVPYYRYGPEGVLDATLGPFPSMEVYRVVTGDDWRLTSLPFPRLPVSAVAGDRFHFGPADGYEIQTYTAAGALERVVRVASTQRSVESEDIERFRRDRLERAEREGSRPSMERMLAQMPFPDVMPPYEALAVDAEGHVWVADYRAGPEEPGTWKVFSPEGQLLGSVVMPRGIRVLQIGPDFVLGQWLDELDTEHIRLHRLVK
ncbi:MAG TPA: 6-bladed beta-propeller [Longimicrobiales bacterium]|nr:6-bladed beta-propeller [Longimicrobiales bacterium]